MNKKALKIDTYVSNANTDHEFSANDCYLSNNSIEAVNMSQTKPTEAENLAIISCTRNNAPSQDFSDENEKNESIVEKSKKINDANIPIDITEAKDCKTYSNLHDDLEFSESKSSVPHNIPVDNNNTTDVLDDIFAAGPIANVDISCNNEDLKEESTDGAAEVSRSKHEFDCSDDEDEELSLTEQCFYASFKIYLSPPPPQQIFNNAYNPASDDHDSVDGMKLNIGENDANLEEELVAAVADGEGRTFEDNDKEDEDGEPSEEDEPTLSLCVPEYNSNPVISVQNLGSTANATVSKCNNNKVDEVNQLCNSDDDEELNELDFDKPFETIGDEINAKGTTSLRTNRVDAVKRTESPVFFLDPLDWLKTEGTSPIPSINTSLAAGCSSTTFLPSSPLAGPSPLSSHYLDPPASIQSPSVIRNIQSPGGYLEPDEEYSCTSRGRHLERNLEVPPGYSEEAKSLPRYSPLRRASMDYRSRSMTPNIENLRGCVEASGENQGVNTNF